MLFLRHSLTTILRTKLKMFDGGFVELEILEIFIRTYFKFCGSLHKEKVETIKAWILLHANFMLLTNFEEQCLG